MAGTNISRATRPKPFNGAARQGAAPAYLGATMSPIRSSGGTLRHLQHLLRMRERFPGNLDAAQHAGNFVTAGLVIEAVDAGFGTVAVGRFADLQMGMSLCGDLGQVGNAKYLALTAEAATAAVPASKAAAVTRKPRSSQYVHDGSSVAGVSTSGT